MGDVGGYSLLNCTCGCKTVFRSSYTSNGVDSNILSQAGQDMTLQGLSESMAEEISSVHM